MGSTILTLVILIVVLTGLICIFLIVKRYTRNQLIRKIKSQQQIVAAEIRQHPLQNGAAFDMNQSVINSLDLEESNLEVIIMNLEDLELKRQRQSTLSSGVGNTDFRRSLHAVP